MDIDADDAFKFNKHIQLIFLKYLKEKLKNHQTIRPNTYRYEVGKSSLIIQVHRNVTQTPPIWVHLDDNANIRRTYI